MKSQENTSSISNTKEKQETSRENDNSQDENIPETKLETSFKSQQTTQKIKTEIDTVSLDLDVLYVVDRGLNSSHVRIREDERTAGVPLAQYYDEENISNKKGSRIAQATRKFFRKIGKIFKKKNN